MGKHALCGLAPKRRVCFGRGLVAAFAAATVAAPAASTTAMAATTAARFDVPQLYVFAHGSWLPSAEYCLVILGAELTMFPSPSICKK